MLCISYKTNFQTVLGATQKKINNEEKWYSIIKTIISNEFLNNNVYTHIMTTGTHGKESPTPPPLFYFTYWLYIYRYVACNVHVLVIIYNVHVLVTIYTMHEYVQGTELLNLISSLNTWCHT
jgi:hypothetical protein